uniref:glycosyltransferase family 2 protein n=1 Tax=Agathobacter sp. TaxID=2021311 RepID=UPI0040575EFB
MISFIIPAYNAEKYLKRTIKSFLHQKSNKYEVIIVENGSTDGTTELAEQLCRQHHFLKLYHSAKGVSAARNLGIQKAEGEWIVFVDADDYLLEDALPMLLKDAEDSSYDLYLYGHESGTQKRLVTERLEGESFSGKDIADCRSLMLKNPTKYMQAWAKLLKRELIVENQIFFDENLRLSEDSDFILRYTKVCKEIRLSKEIVYHYSIDNCSVMRQGGGNKMKEYTAAMRETESKLAGEEPEILEAFQMYVLMHLNIGFVRDIFDTTNSDSFFKKVSQMKQITKEKIFAKAISKVKFKEGLSIRMIPILCLKYRLYVVSGCIYSLRACMNKKRENK